MGAGKILIMSYLIETEIKGHKYWLRTEEILNQQGMAHPNNFNLSFQGLIDNATEYPSLHKADKMISIVQRRTRNHLNAVQKPKIN